MSKDHAKKMGEKTKLSKKQSEKMDVDKDGDIDSDDLENLSGDEK